METFSIPLIYKRSKTDVGKRVLLPLEELLFLRIIGKHVYFYGTQRKEYVLQSTLSDWRILLDGVGFDEVDRGILANMRKALFIYSDLQQIHFGPEAEGVFCPIAGAHIARVQRQYPHIPIRRSGAI
jgi:hypothetical protein